MEPGLKLSKMSSSLPVDATEYRGIVGCLRYLVHTWPDISYAVGYVSRFMHGEPHRRASCRSEPHSMLHCRHHLDYGCHYKKIGAELKLLRYSDSDMASDVDTRKSTTAMLFFYGSSLVSWQSQK